MSDIYTKFATPNNAFFLLQDPGDWLIRESRAIGALSITFLTENKMGQHARYALLPKDFSFEKPPKGYVSFDEAHSQTLQWRQVSQYTSKEVSEAVERYGVKLYANIIGQETYMDLLNHIKQDFPELKEQKHPTPQEASSTPRYVDFIQPDNKVRPKK